MVLIAVVKEGMDLELRRVSGRISSASKIYRANDLTKVFPFRRCVQDPYNVTDKNAIEVRHSRGQRVGYVAKALAERLTPLLDQRKIRLAAVAGEGAYMFHRPSSLASASSRDRTLTWRTLAVPSNTVGLAKVPMRLEIYGKRKYATDSRLDFCFPDRMRKKQEAEKRRKDQEVLERKLLDRENKQLTGGSLRSKKGGRPGQNGGGGSGGGQGRGAGDSDVSHMAHTTSEPRKAYIAVSLPRGR